MNLRFAAIALVVRGLGYAQDPAPPGFEAASIKPHLGEGKRDGRRVIEPGRITYTDVTLGELMMFAYGVKRYQLSGPPWVTGGSSAVTFDLAATAGKAVSENEIRRMIGPLLAERFHLEFHRETRDLPVLALVAAKGGPKNLKPGTDGAPAIRSLGGGTLSFQNWSMEYLADWLTKLPGIGLPVVDRTGLAGNFSFDANLFGTEKEGGAEFKKAMMGAEAADTLRSALPLELGLKLEPQHARLDVLVIDRADRAPIEN